jgi:hypothetical protein
MSPMESCESLYPVALAIYMCRLCPPCPMHVYGIVQILEWLDRMLVWCRAREQCELALV